MSKSRIQSQFHDDFDPSLSDVNQGVLSALRVSRPRRLEGGYFKLLDEIKDPYLSEMIWIIYGESSLRVVKNPFDLLNDDRRWWEFWREKNTIVSLVRTNEGKAWVWQFLHDATAWLL